MQGFGTLPIALSGNSALMNGRLGLWDGGRVLTSHQELGTSRIAQKDNPTALSNHATHLAGTLVAQGINPLAKGMAYGAQLSVWDYADDMTELVAAAPNLLISNHAYAPVTGWLFNASRPGTDSNLKWEWWGNTSISETEDYLFGFYTTKARDLDRVAYNNPFYLMVRSADNKRSETGPPANTVYFLKNTSTQSTLARSRNDAYDVIPAEATAKNVLTVGAANVGFTGQNQLIPQGSTSFSGWGPTDDGRIKPDLLGIGSDVFSTLSTSTTEYGIYGGTSMASANVSGTLFLLQELYARQRGPGMPATGQFMRAATLKALALHTADRPTPAAGPDYRQGWGLLNAEAAARLVLNEELAHQILEQSLPAGSSFSRSVVAQGNEPLVVTLCWTDPEGLATPVAASSLNSRAPKLVNDLDLRISDGSVSVQPWVLDPGNPSAAATRGNNSRDNVEQVYIANPTAGKTYTISVSHKGKMTYTSQPFSLIMSGLRRKSCQLTASVQPKRDTTICAGTALPLQSENQSPGLSYQWLRNGTALPSATNPVYLATQAGSYLLLVKDSQGCSASSQPVQVQLQTPTIGLTPQGDQWLCDNQESVQLQVGALTGNSQNGTVIEWLRDKSVIAQAHAASFTATQPGSYQVRVTQNGCQSLSTETKVLASSVNNLDIAPHETTLMLPQGASVLLKAPLDSSYSYQWFRNDQALANALEYQLSVVQAGTYKVQITQQHCVGWSSSRFVQTALLTATTPDPDGSFSVYPNPAETTLSIRYINLLTKQVDVDLSDLRGTLRQPTYSIKAQNGQINSQLSIQHLPPGQYIIRLTDGLTTQVRQFIKK
ncbi:S8 family peptidase [Spirosoma areae]